MYNWRIFEDLKLNSNADYINSCCEFCDTVLEKIKPEISERMNVDLKDIVIGQEDWGWYLEFQKDATIYILSLSYQDKDDEGAHNFGVTVEAQRIKKRFIFNRKIEAEKEQDEFAEIIEAIARQFKIQFFKE
jgi:hypothetical protein